MSQDSLKIAVIGGGAAGFFAAMNCAAHYPQHQVTLLEKSSKLLSKVKVSGGGRCNVTHACFDRIQLSKHYPRGAKFLKTAFNHFMPQNIIEWLQKRQVEVKTEADGRMFPSSDESQTIIDCFLEECDQKKVLIQTRQEVKAIIPQEDGSFILKIKREEDLVADRVIIASGGSPKESGLDWIKSLGHTIETPVPSLFSFNIPDDLLLELQGVVAPRVQLKIRGTKLSAQGPLLVTHWGMSGPAILKLSAWGARVLNAFDYKFFLHVNWLDGTNEEIIRTDLRTYKSDFPFKKVKNQSFDLSKRLWGYFLNKTHISEEKKWGELSKSELNKLVAVLSNDVYDVAGKTTFKDEFVTCGGVSLKDISVHTMESRKVPNLYFCGEILDIDGITGGFNFQAAWTTAYVAGIQAGIIKTQIN